jgi:hypothetical protein
MPGQGADPVNMVPIGAGIILAIGPVSQQITSDFSLSGIALGTVVVLGGYHLLRALAGKPTKEVSGGEVGFERNAGG